MRKGVPTGGRYPIGRTEEGKQEKRTRATGRWAHRMQGRGGR